CSSRYSAAWWTASLTPLLSILPCCRSISPCVSFTHLPVIPLLYYGHILARSFLCPMRRSQPWYARDRWFSSLLASTKSKGRSPSGLLTSEPRARYFRFRPFLPAVKASLIPIFPCPRFRIAIRATLNCNHWL